MTFLNNREKIIFYHLPTILFVGLPFFLISGPFLSDLSISIISMLFIIYCFKKNDYSSFNNKFFYFFLLFYIYLLANSLFNNPNLDSLKISFFYFRYGFFVIAVIALLKENDKFLKYFFYCLFACFVSLITDGFYEYFYKSTGNRITSFFGDEEILGSYLSRLWPIFFGLSLIFIKNKSKSLIFISLIFILSEALIFLSGDRTAFFYINLSGIFIIIFSKNLFKLRLITLLSSILIIVIISFFNPSAKERVIDYTIDQMNLTYNKQSNLTSKNSNEQNKEIYIFSKEHTHHYITAYRIFLDNKIFGVGVKNFRFFCENEDYRKSALSCSTHPHNSYIQILSETGIIGFLFLIIILIFFCKKIFFHIFLKFKGKTYFNDFEICILSCLAIYLWPLAPTGNIFNNWLNIMMILNLPLLVWGKNSIKC